MLDYEPNYALPLVNGIEKKGTASVLKRLSFYFLQLNDYERVAPHTQLLWEQENTVEGGGGQI